MKTATPRLSSPLKVWERLEILVGPEGKRGRYVARIQDFLDVGILITEPEFAGGDVRLKDGDHVLVSVVRDDAVYEFDSRVTRQGTGKATRVVLDSPRGFQRVQRRGYVRIEMIQRMEYAKVTKTTEWPRFEQSVTWIKSLSADISGGGVRFRLDESVTPGSLVVMRGELFSRLNLPQPILGAIRRLCRIDKQAYAGVEFIRDDQMGSFLKGPELNAIPDRLKAFDQNVQNSLVSFVFNEQLVMRRKGLL